MCISDIAKLSTANHFSVAPFNVRTIQLKHNWETWTNYKSSTMKKKLFYKLTATVC